jgi:hypothetical protein
MTDRELIDRASKRCDWAGRALESAAQDLHDAAVAGAPVDGTAALVRDEAGRGSRLAENVAAGGALEGEPAPKPHREWWRTGPSR